MAATGARGATPRPRSGAEAGRTPCPKGCVQEELPHVLGEGQRLRVPDCNGAGTAERSYPATEVGGAGGPTERRYPMSKVRGGHERNYPMSEVRGGGWEELPHFPKPKARGGGREELCHAPKPEAKGGGLEEQPHSHEARGSGQEDQPHIQGSMAV